MRLFVVSTRSYHEFIFSKISITYHYLIISIHISIGNE